MNYINIKKKRLCGRNNNLVDPLVIDYATEETLSFQFIDDKNQIQPIEAVSGYYLAGSLGIGLRSTELLFLSKDYNICSGNILQFEVDTYTTNYLNKIKKKFTEINIELGLSNETEKQVLMRDFALACPRVYVDGQAPIDPEEISGYYTKTEVNNLLTLKQNLITESSKLDFSLISGASFVEDDPVFRSVSGTLSSAIDAKQNALTAGENITISGNTISASAPVQDVRIEGSLQSLVSGGIANIPVTRNDDVLGLCKVSSNGNYTGVSVWTGYGNTLGIVGQPNNQIDNRVNWGGAIKPNSIDYAVRSVVPNITTIPTATTAFSLLDATAKTNNHSCTYYHKPLFASSYTLPTVTDNTVTHDIVLYADFASTASVVFQDSLGNIIEVKSSLTPAVGEKWAFYCSYEFGKWNIYGLRIEEAENA